MAKRKLKSFKIKLAEVLLLIFLFFSAVMLAFSSGSFVLNFKKIGFSFISSIDKGIHYVGNGVKDTVNAIGELHKLQKDYEELTLKLQNYEEMKRNNADIRKENERLKELLDYSVSLDVKNIPAQIISRELDNSYGYITINKGSTNGIKKNMPVVGIQTGNNGLVGKIVQVGPFTSQIMPIYNSDCIISARIQNTRDLGLVRGQGREDMPLILQYIRKRVYDEVHIGDVIVTSGENDNYMRDIPVGSITKIDILEYNSSLLIQMTPIIDFSRLENVIVVNQKELNDRKS